MTPLQQIGKFVRKTPAEKRVLVRFLTRKWLGKIPYLPNRVYLTTSEPQPVTFWWSYVPSGFREDRGISDYWGDDIGELRLLWRLLQPGMVFLDIGAYHGSYSLIAAKKLRGTGRVIAFEPSPRERRRLNLHMRYNRIRSVTVEPYAVAGRAEKALLQLVGDGYETMNSLRAPAIDLPATSLEVETITLAEYLSRTGIDRVDVIKIDTEGAELSIFSAASDVLTRLRPLIICEVLDRVTEPWGYRAREIVTYLQNFDYVWFDIHPEGTVTKHLLRDDYPEGGNYLAVPGTQQHLFA